VGWKAVEIEEILDIGAYRKNQRVLALRRLLSIVL
jgi:hypothetical protein